MYRAAAGESGLSITGEFSGGCADSGFTAAVGAPTICAVGPVGGKAHSPEEYLEVASWCRGPRPWRGLSCGWTGRGCRSPPPGLASIL